MSRRLMVLVAGLLATSPGFGYAQRSSPDSTVIRIEASASEFLIEEWRDWRRTGPENGGFCIVGGVTEDEAGTRVVDVRRISRSARVRACGGTGDIGAGVFVTGELFSKARLTDLACAALEERDDWVLFGIVHGTKRKLLLTGEVVTVTQGKWCVSSTARRPELDRS